MIYIVEDDESIRQMESYALKNSGFEVREFSNGTDFLIACAGKAPDMAVLDIMLPGTDGLSVLSQLRSDPATKAVPVVMVTAKASELDVVKGLDAGADDYITKPFGIMEFISRVKAVMRRIEPQEALKLKLRELFLDDGRRVVEAGGEPCQLTYMEHEVLKYMMSNVGIVLSRDKLMDNVWGMDYEGGTRTVDMHIKTLRQKLGACGAYIKTVRNVGYKID